MDINTKKIDSAAIDAGQWVDKIPEWPGARFRVRGIGSATAESLRDQKLRAVPDDGRDEEGNVLPHVVKRVAREVLAEAVCLEWDGLTDGDQPFPYSMETAVEYITNPDFTNFADAVAWCARQVDKRNTGAKKAAVKNSAKPSSGS